MIQHLAPIANTTRRLGLGGSFAGEKSLFHRVAIFTAGAICTGQHVADAGEPAKGLIDTSTGPNDQREHVFSTIDQRNSSNGLIKHCQLP